MTSKANESKHKNNTINYRTLRRIKWAVKLPEPIINLSCRCVYVVKPPWNLVFWDSTLKISLTRTDIKNNADNSIVLQSEKKRAVKCQDLILLQSCRSAHVKALPRNCYQRGVFTFTFENDHSDQSLKYKKIENSLIYFIFYFI